MGDLVGVTIGNIDTYAQYGLALLDNLYISAPPLKQTMINVPGADGALNWSYALTNGEPRYERRILEFDLYAPDNETDFISNYQDLMALCHGLENKLWLPMDDTHYYYGLFSFGTIVMYEMGQIPITVYADPYMYKNNVTTQTITLTGTTGGDIVTLQNEQRAVSPSFTTTASDINITFGDTTYAMSPGTFTFPGLRFVAGSNVLTIEGAQGEELTISYQEAKL